MIEKYFMPFLAIVIITVFTLLVISMGALFADMLKCKSVYGYYNCKFVKVIGE